MRIMLVLRKKVKVCVCLKSYESKYNHKCKGCCLNFGNIYILPKNKNGIMGLVSNGAFASWLFHTIQSLTHKIRKILKMNSYIIIT